MGSIRLTRGLAFLDIVAKTEQRILWERLNVCFDLMHRRFAFGGLSWPDLPVEWLRASQLHLQSSIPPLLPALSPTPIDTLRLAMERMRRDGTPGAEQCAWAGSITASGNASPIFLLCGLIHKHRLIGHGLLFVEIDVMKAGRVRIQVIVRRHDCSAFRSEYPDVAERWQAPPADFDTIVALSEQGAILTWRVTLGKSITGRGSQGQPSVYALSLCSVLRTATHPAALSRFASMAVGSSPVVPPAIAASALRVPVSSLEEIAQAPHRKLAALSRRLQGATSDKRSRRRKAHLSAAEIAALASIEARACAGDLSVRELQLSCGAIAAAVTLGSIDPSLNLPSASDWRRMRYAETKKRPQVMWMVERAREMLCRNWKAARIIDIGGGRGDLALALAAAGAGYVTVIDTNAPSLIAGRERAEIEGLSARMSFLEADAATSSGSYDLVVALHACGGLSEVALSLAANVGASFLICTCCFSSHPHLAFLTGNGSGGPMSPEVGELRRLAEKKSQPVEASRASAALNALRLAAAREMFMRKLDGRGTLKTQQLAFSERYSKANRVLYGLLRLL